MTHGPGKYDHLATHVRSETNAAAVVVIVLDGNQGSGFAVQTHAIADVRALAAALRSAAEQMERDALGMNH